MGSSEEAIHHSTYHLIQEIRTLKTELHKEHEKLTITEWELNESKKKEKKPVQIERVNVMDMSKEDMLNLLE